MKSIGLALLSLAALGIASSANAVTATSRPFMSMKPVEIACGSRAACEQRCQNNGGNKVAQCIQRQCSDCKKP